MKTLLLALFVFATVNTLQSQDMITIQAEQIPIPASIDSALNEVMGGTGEIVTYRVYAAFPDGWALNSILGSGVSGSPLSIQSGNTFYQDPYGAATAFELLEIAEAELLPYDSWFTIGITNMSEASAYEITLVLGSSPFFYNFELGYDAEVSMVNNGQMEEAAIVASTISNGQFTSVVNQPDENGRVLIGQFTTRQFVSGCATLHLVNTDPASNEEYEQEVCFSFTPEFLNGDLDGDGYVTASDVLILLDQFGCMGGCNADLTGDNLVSVNDLTSFIYYYSFNEPVN